MPTLDLDPPALPARQAAPARFSVLLHEGPGNETALLDLLAEAGLDARVIRVGNPLRAPLTIERILIQTGLVEAGLLTDEEADQALQQLVGDGGRTVLVIRQAETLSRPALQTLARLAHSPAQRSAGHAASLHIVFVGEPGFAGLVLATPNVEPIRAALPYLPKAVPSGDTLPEVDLPPAVPQPSLAPPAFSVQAEAPLETASWFQVVSAGTEAAPPAEHAPALLAIPARSRSWQVFWTLLLFFLVGVGSVLGTAVLLQR